MTTAVLPAGMVQVPLVIKTFPEGDYAKAADFLKRTLAPYVTDQIEISIDMEKGCQYSWRHEPPRKRARKDKRHFVEAGVGNKMGFPFDLVAPVGTVQLDRLAAKLMGLGKPFEYVYDREDVDNEDEMAVWAAAMGVFRYLRKTKQIGGRLSRTDAARYAYDLLRRFRCEQGKMMGKPQRLFKRDSLMGDGVLMIVNPR